MLGFYDEKGLFDPEKLIKPVTGMPETCVVTWQDGFYRAAMKLGAREITRFKSGTVQIIYFLNHRGTKVGYAQIPPGAPMAAAFVEELHAAGCRNFVFIGSCGVLDPEVEDKLVVPVKAFRDEGTSWHYIASTDNFIDVPLWEHTDRVLTELGAPHVCGPVWTTDALYRETPSAVRRMKSLGCICVEMECAAVMAAAQYRKANAAYLLYSTDIVSGEDWKNYRFTGMKGSAFLAYLNSALELALSFEGLRGGPAGTESQV